MGKKRNFLIVFLILLVVAAGNIYLYFRNVRMSVSGHAIEASSVTSYVKLYAKEIYQKMLKLDFSTIAFIIQWILIFLIVLIFYVKFLKRKRDDRKETVSIEIRKEKGKGKAHTDLDTLYDLLKEKKHLKISSIAKSFKMDSDKAIEWCKILEDHNLVDIDYPAFSEPEVMIK